MTTLSNCQLTVEDTLETYSGMSGRCMCGCAGTYHKGERARKMAITKLLKSDNLEIQKFDRVHDGYYGCIFQTTETRHNVLYLNESGFKKAEALLNN